MVEPPVREPLALYRARIERELPGRLRRIALFGSWARGEAHDESDVDVLVVLSHATARERSHVIDLGAYVGLESRLPIAPLVLTQAEWEELVRRERGLPREIDREGIDV